jgi:ribosomal protein S18 acetylase RimI-like enzyme
MKIRKMVTIDYQDAYKLWASESSVGLRSIDDSISGIEKFLQRNPSTCFVSEEDGEITGTILCGSDGRRGYIYHAMVSKECRRNGTGRRLVAKVLKELEKMGINKAALVVFADNEQGNKFWESLGFYSRGDLVYRDKALNPDNI